MELWTNPSPLVLLHGHVSLIQAEQDQVRGMTEAGEQTEGLILTLRPVRKGARKAGDVRRALGYLLYEYYGWDVVGEVKEGASPESTEP